MPNIQRRGKKERTVGRKLYCTGHILSSAIYVMISA